MHVGEQPAAMLSIKRLAGVAPEVDLGEYTLHSPLQGNEAEPSLALKPRWDVTRNPKQGYQWPQKGHKCPPIFFFKKFSNRNAVRFTWRSCISGWIPHPSPDEDHSLGNPPSPRTAVHSPPYRLQWRYAVCAGAELSPGKYKPIKISLNLANVTPVHGPRWHYAECAAAKLSPEKHIGIAS